MENPTYKQCKALINKLSNKELTFGCVLKDNMVLLGMDNETGYYYASDIKDEFILSQKGVIYDEEIIGHPVMIGDILKKLQKRSLPDLHAYNKMILYIVEKWSFLGIDKSLQEILTSLAEQRSVEDALTLDVTLSFPEPLFLPPDHVAQVTPIIQEAISNARKHSNATQIQVNGQQLEDQVSITVEDDGRGFDIDDTISRDESHFGLRIMRARAARFDGNLQIISKPDYGTIVTLSWILNHDRRERLQQSNRSELPILKGETHV